MSLSFQKKLCQNDLKYEKLEEEIYIKYIEALIALGRIKQAQNHCEDIMKIFKDWGGKASR